MFHITGELLSRLVDPFPNDEFFSDFMYVAQVIRSIKTKDSELLSKQKSVAKRLVKTYRIKWYHLLSKRGNLIEGLKIGAELERRCKLLFDFIETIEYAK